MRHPSSAPADQPGAAVSSKPQTQSSAPNVVGYLLEEARTVLAEAGWAEVEITETRPPRRELIGPRRVLRQRTAGSRIALVVSGERTEDART